jgi:hypothetical protein
LVLASHVSPGKKEKYQTLITTVSVYSLHERERVDFDVDFWFSKYFELYA